MRLKSSFFSFGIVFLSVLSCICCTGGSKGGDAGEATQQAASSVQTVKTDTLIGWVGDGTSMHNLELLPVGGDTMELDLDDDVDRRADLIVGHDIAVVLQRGSNSEQHVIAIMDVEETNRTMPSVFDNPR